MVPKRVALIATDWPGYEKYCPNFTGMQDGLKTLGIAHKLIPCRPDLNVYDVISYQPDLIIYGLLDMVRHPEWRMAIRTALPHAKIVFWYGDLRTEKTGQVHDDMSEINMMFVSNNAQREFYMRRWHVPDCQFLPLGATIRNPSYDRNFDFDFVFIGARITGSEFMERAIEIGKYQEQGLEIIDASAQRFPKLRAKVLKTMPTIYRSSKICLDISHFTNIDSYTSNRYWNITASGGFALTKRFPNCEKFYPKGTRVYFDTFEESLKLRDYYLSHPKEREKIRLAGHAHAKYHTYEHRFLDMFQKLYG